MNPQALTAPGYPLPPGIGKLTAFKVATLSKPGRHCDGAGLYLQISPKGAKSWIFRYIYHGEKRYMGLGPLHTFSLDEARIAARHARIHIWYDRDPQQERCRNKGGWTQPVEEEHNKTFNECLTEYFASHKTEWRSAKYVRQWESALLKHISPHLGELPVRQINTTHILEALTPIWRTLASAPRLRGRIERILSWATVYGYRKGDNPARWRGNLKELLAEPDRIRTVQHHPSLPYQNISAFFEQLMTREGRASRALAFTILTACRSAEVRLAQWSEIDFEQAVWTIPAQRMKTAQAHRVPLSALALKILRGQQGKDPRWVFPGARPGKPVSGTALLDEARRIDANVTVHGFRSTFRVWAAEKTDAPREVAEMSLAHKTGSRVEMAYQRSDLLEHRRVLMDKWALLCAKKQRSDENPRPATRAAPTTPSGVQWLGGVTRGPDGFVGAALVAALEFDDRTSLIRDLGSSPCCPSPLADF